MVSRFRSPKENKAVIDDVVRGKVDIVVGTHRLLSKDVQFATGPYRPPEDFDIKTVDIDVIQAPQIGAGLPSELLLRRPDIGQAEALLCADHAHVDAEC